MNGVLAPHSVEVTREALKEIQYCGICTDGSNHGAVKIFPIIIQYFDWKNGGEQTKLIEVKDTPNEKAETIANYLTETLAKKQCLKNVLHLLETIATQIFVETDVMKGETCVCKFKEVSAEQDSDWCGLPSTQIE